ncbi:MAG: primosomal protein N' [Flavobacteriales bacterium]|nr:primosomal protein N' [Flavobacteriales bacterium]
MSGLATFIDVVIPIAIPNLLTYRVPRELEGYVQFGQRVVVQLGRSKLYTAVVHRVHDQPPQAYEAKYIESLLDEVPIVTKKQMRLWEWMAEYYMCTLGEVLGSALPSSLKLASETKIVAHPDIEELDASSLTDREFLLMEALELRKVLEIAEVAEILEIKTVQPIIKSLIEKGFATTEEELKHRYKPKTEERLSLHPRLENEDLLSEVFDQLEKRARKQSELLLCYLRERETQGHSIGKVALQKMAGADSTVAKKLIEKEVFVTETVEIDRIGPFKGEHQEIKDLSEDQQRALQEIKDHYEDKDVVLLHGVTGSGKTEVYVKLIEECIARGEQVLYLLPEIALTTQLIQRLQKYFGDQIGVFHSKFNQQERAETWKRTMSGEANSYSIIMGARSSVFLPFRKLGLVIVDEEHESSFKQYDPAPRYNGRDAGVVLGMLHKAKVLLGSATPSIESYFNTTEGRYGLVEMKHRFGGVVLPEILTANIRKELQRKTMKSHFTSFLLEEMKEALERDEQIILFQNRRGYSPFWQCHTCGWVPECDRCDVSLTYHKHVHHLNCHYCGYTSSPPLKCQACGSHDLRSVGFGTEKIEEDLKELFPEARVARMDLDTTRSKNAYQNILRSFDQHEIDILVGTQMVTKGLDFERVSLVGVLNADQMLKFPDFRAYERAFQLMTQVAGRAGRKHKRGKVIIQTYDPEHWVIHQVIDNDYDAMYRREVIERKEYKYPPHTRLIKLNMRHRNEGFLRASAHELAAQLRQHLGDRVVGPEAPYVARINNQYHQNILLKVERTASPAQFKKVLQDTIDNFRQDKEKRAIRFVPDVDPA